MTKEERHLWYDFLKNLDVGFKRQKVVGKYILDFYYENKDADDASLVKAVLSNEKMWDQDLTKIEGLYDTVLADLTKIRTEGAEAAYASVL